MACFGPSVPSSDIYADSEELPKEMFTGGLRVQFATPKLCGLT
jgi:hypothetical protein